MRPCQREHRSALRTFLILRRLATARSILGKKGSLRKVAMVTVGLRCRVMPSDPGIAIGSFAAARTLRESSSSRYER